MAPSPNSTSQQLPTDSPVNHSASTPPSTSSESSSSAAARTVGTPHYQIKFHPLLEAQTKSFNESLEASANSTEMSNYSSSPSDYSYPSSTSGATYGSNSTVSQVSKINVP